MDIIFEKESLDTFTNVSQEILTNLYNSKNVSDKYVDPHILEKAKEDVKNLISNCNYDLTEVAKTLHSKSWDQDKVNIFLSTMKNQTSKLLYSALLHHNSTYGDSVTNFDWLLKLVLGTNDLKSLQYPLLQLILFTNSCSGQKEKLVYDINKDMLAKIINVLGNIDEIQ